MKFSRSLTLMAVAAAALMAFAGTASATTLTSPPGTILKSGTVIHAESEGHVVLDSAIGKIECNSTVEGKTTNSGGTGVNVEGNISTLAFTGCTTAVVKVLKSGTFKIISTGTNGGTLESTGAEVTVETFGVHCIFKTNATTIGTITGGSAATLDIHATIPQTSSNIFCGSSAPWTGSYKVTKPNPLIFD